MLWRAVVAFLALPGLVAIAVPAWMAASALRAGGAFHAIGLVPLGAGFVLLLWCVRDFYVSGRGTLAPWAPPRKLVVVGLYRYTRNPMYVAVTLVLFGWAWAFGSVGLLLYAAVVAIAFHLRVVLGEEPWLARAFGSDWQQYAGRVPRWFW